MKRLVDERPGLETEIRIKFMGIGGEIVQDLVKKYGLTDQVEMSPFATHRESIQFLMDADVLLLDRETVPKDKIAVVTTSAKVFEYLATGKPLLAVVPPESAAAEIVRSTESGVVAEPDSPENVAEKIHGLYRQYINGTLVVDRKTDLAKFERENQAGHLAQVLEDSVTTGLKRGQN
jgi:glycosyltransferase involved in cell wall biosynthesis